MTAELYYQDDWVTLLHGDCLDMLQSLPDASVDAVVTDPPYGLEFMGKEWDKFGGDTFQEWCEAWSRECLRVLKPGGHMLAFGGTRTFHRLACAVEDAGFEIRDSIAWLYGSGFPKSLDVSKAVSPATPDAERWQGWGTALKPAFEPVVVARKPLAGTVVANVLTHGTGALNVDGCRIDGSQVRSPLKADGTRSQRVGHEGWDRPWKQGEQRSEHCALHGVARCTICLPAGRWPANVVLDESQAEALDLMSGERLSAGRSGSSETAGDLQAEGWGVRKTGEPVGFGDFGGASRFMYVAKADAAERVRINGTAHPTVKPLALMRWLVRLVTPPGGTVLEPFAGSGTTVEACLLEGFKCIAAEREVDYLPLIVQRINRRRDPVKAILASGEEDTLFGGVA